MPNAVGRRIWCCRFLLVTAITVAVGASAEANLLRKSRKEREEAAKPWVNAKGLCVFQFPADDLPPTADGFAAALAEGCRKGASLPEDSQVVQIEGAEGYPAVRSLQINLSDAKVDLKSKKDKDRTRPPDRWVPEGAVGASHFELAGHRIAVEESMLSVGVTASDVRLDYTRDRKGKPLLMLAAAKDGELLFEMTHGDLELLLLAMFRQHAGKFGLAVNRTRLRLRSDGGRSVWAELKVNTTFAGVPADLKFRARLDVDDRLNGRLSDLSCTGDKALGPLISGVIEPALRKYDGKERPLVAFPQGRVRLHDLKIDTDEVVRVSAKFGS